MLLLSIVFSMMTPLMTSANASAIPVTASTVSFHNNNEGPIVVTPPPQPPPLPPPVQPVWTH